MPGIDGPVRVGSKPSSHWQHSSTGRQANVDQLEYRVQYDASAQIIYGVSVAFYSSTAARERAAAASQSLKNARDVETAADDRYKNGVGTVVEVSQAHQNTAQAKLALVQDTGAVENAYLNLISAVLCQPPAEPELETQ
jgi:outer membrane protein TolC